MKINYTPPEYVWRIPFEIGVRLFLYWYFFCVLSFVGDRVILSSFSVEPLLTQEKQWRRDSSAISRSFVASFFIQRTPQTKTNITETTEGFTDGTKSKSRWDSGEFKGFIFFYSKWTIVFCSHLKTDFWRELASIKWSFEIGPKIPECYIMYCYSWRVAAIAVDLPHSYNLALHQNVLKASAVSAVKSIF